MTDCSSCGGSGTYPDGSTCSEAGVVTAPDGRHYVSHVCVPYALRGADNPLDEVRCALHGHRPMTECVADARRERNDLGARLVRVLEALLDAVRQTRLSPVRRVGAWTARAVSVSPKSLEKWRQALAEGVGEGMKCLRCSGSGVEDASDPTVRVLGHPDHPCGACGGTGRVGAAPAAGGGAK